MHTDVALAYKKFKNLPKIGLSNTKLIALFKYGTEAFIEAHINRTIAVPLVALLNRQNVFALESE